MITADDPEPAIVLQDAPHRREPVAGKLVIGLEGVELVPIIVDRVDNGIVGPEKLTLKLEIIGRIGKHQIHRFLRKFIDQFNAVADQNLVERQRVLRRHIVRPCQER